MGLLTNAELAALASIRRLESLALPSALAIRAALREAVAAAPERVRTILMYADLSHPDIRAALLTDAAMIVRRMMAQRGDLTAEEQAVLAADAESAVRSTLVSQATSLGELAAMRLVNDPECHVRCSLAHHALPEALVAQLLADLDDQVRAGMAEHHPVLTSEQLTRLAADASAFVRAVLATRPPHAEEVSTMAVLLETLGRDRSSAVRTAVARRPDCPPAQLPALAADRCMDVRYAVASRHDLPATLRANLLTDRQPAVRTAAAGGSWTPRGRTGILVRP